jgi:hypothetical protein
MKDELLGILAGLFMVFMTQIGGFVSPSVKFFSADGGDASNTISQKIKSLEQRLYHTKKIDHKEKALFSKVCETNIMKIDIKLTRLEGLKKEYTEIFSQLEPSSPIKGEIENKIQKLNDELREIIIERKIWKNMDECVQ